ncbi:MAG: LysR family transcriptional regulator [Eubacteriales bacterium]|nr:LysR family transcriptional regulator [Eubacteriales bacterium]
MTHLEIEAFFEIIKSGSISLAAQNLYVTQPALSRRIKTLEEELGYALFLRRKGQRRIELTPQGEAFVSVARKWQTVWQEARDLCTLDTSNVLNISSVGSVSSYILPQVFESISKTPGAVSRVCFHNYHSFEAYQYVLGGLVDIALISDDIYCKDVETIPAFQEPMVLAANSAMILPDNVHPKDLDCRQEIRLPWNPEYDAWHDFWFGPAPEYRVFLDQMNLLEYMLSWENTWAVVPLSVAHRISSFDCVAVRQLEAPPPERIIYYLKSGSRKEAVVHRFLEALDETLRSIPGVTSFLGSHIR